MLWKAAARLLVASMVLTSARAQESKSSADVVKLSLPDKSWSLAIELPGFAVEKNEIQPDGRRYMAAANAETGVAISTYLEKTKAPADLEGCKATLEARAKAPAPFKKMGLSIYDLNGMKVLEYLVPEIERRRVHEKNFYVCIPKEDVFVDIHLSKAAWQLGQEKLFAVILANLSFEENPPAPSP
jgi:hypothetical protein